MFIFDCHSATNKGDKDDLPCALILSGKSFFFPARDTPMASCQYGEMSLSARNKKNRVFTLKIQKIVTRSQAVAITMNK